MNTLQNLAETAGISSSYIDKTGQTHYTTDDVRHFFLNAMNIPANTENEINSSITKLNQKPLIADTLTFFNNEPVEFDINDNEQYSLVLKDENQNIIWQEDSNNRQKINIPTALKEGYYTLTAYQDNQIKTQSLLIYAPAQCYQPQYIQNREHLYGVSLMVYALKSENSLGIGDFGDLKEIIKLTAINGGDAVGINPLGVMSPYTLPAPLFNGLRGDVSPYRSLSRLFINYIYLDLKSEPDFQNAPEVQSMLQNSDVQDEIKHLNDSPNVLYAAVLQLKLRLLGLMYEYFIKENSLMRHKAFNEYKQEKGEELANLCLFEALLEVHQNEPFWRFWQDETDDINSPATESFRNINQKRIDFFAYCHWLADKQVKSIQALAKSLGMKIGLYADMPIGAASNGAEVWQNPSAYVLETGIGAPADPMRPRGQSWGFTPYHPITLAKQHYAPFIRLVRENMSYAGALRIDHAMGLRRLFWGFFTSDNPVVQGCYVYYDIKALTAILAI
ncbi:MAG: 4-alpha-glucanotransferase, partial [Alphaproteobacteria bacterium]|nr:4-alpha-glucanotransferase [Alphaproteobacteria bacterium]